MNQLDYNTLKKIELFLDIIFPGAQGVIEVSGYSDLKAQKDHLHQMRRFSEKKASIIEYFFEKRDYFRRKNNGFFFGVLRRKEPGNGKKEAMLPGSVVWVDIDNKETGGQQESLRQLNLFPLPPSILVYSGGGLHAYWRLLEPEEPRSIETINRKLIATCGGDKSAFNCNRILRFPYSWHCKDKPKLVEIKKMERSVYPAQAFYSLLRGQSLPMDHSWSQKEKMKEIKFKKEFSPKVRSLYVRRPKVKAYFLNQGREGPKVDPSPSAYDFQFVKELLWHGVTMEEASNALFCKMVQEDRKEKVRSIRTTVENANRRIQGAKNA